MKNNQQKWPVAIVFLLPYCAFGATLQELESRVQELEDAIQSVQEESSNLNTAFDRSMKVSGYADVEYHVVDDNGSGNSDKGFRLHNTNLFLNKQILEKWHFYAEIAFSDGPFIAHEENAQGVQMVEGEGRIDLEATNIDFQYRSYLSMRLGRLFTPAGIWLTDHEPPFVPTQELPLHVAEIFPASVDGLMLYGVQPLANTFMNYHAYMVNGINNGGDGDVDQKRAFGGKAALVLPWFSFMEIGASYYKDNLIDGTEFRAQGAHLKVNMRILHIQAEYALGKYNANDVITENSGYYAQAYIDWSNWTLGGRFDVFDQEDIVDQVRASYFINYRIGNNVVVKLEHHATEKEDPQALRTDEHRNIISMVVYLGD